MKICFQILFKLIYLKEKFFLDTYFEDFLEIDWEKLDNQKLWFVNTNEFINNSIHQVHSDFHKLFDENNNTQNDYVKIFKEFIACLLNKFMQYLPFKGEIVKTVDFVELKDKYMVLEEKIRKFNNVFQIVNGEELQNLVFPQLLRLRDIGLEYYQRNEKDTALDIWTRIIQSGKYPSLAKFAKFSQALPTSSSDLEQAFSIIKLFRTNQRNRLAENSLEGLILIHQEFQGNENIKLPENVLRLYLEMKHMLNKEKW